MPTAALKACSRCGSRYATRCAQCVKALDQRRGSASSRGYDAQWVRFKAWFITQLIGQHIVPVCGATLPSGPQTTDSRCRQQGWFMADGLHLDHEPPLEPWERADAARVCDPHRVQLLCATCHSTKTRAEQVGHQVAGGA